MVVLAAGLISKSGNLLLSRSFVSISKMKLDALFAQFARSVAAAQQMFIDTDAIRYVYQSFDEVYLVLLTPKQSNVLAALDALRLCAKILPEHSALTERAIEEHSFELVFVLDELISSGYSESVTNDQVNAFLSMESAAEQKVLERRREMEKQAHKDMLEKAMAIDKEKAMREKAGIKSSMTGFGSDTRTGSMSGMSSFSSASSSSASNNNSSSNSSNSAMSHNVEKTQQPAQAATSKVAGMKLGKDKPKTADLLANLIKEGEIPGGAGGAASAQSAQQQQQQQQQGGSASQAQSSGSAAGGRPLTLTFNENVTVNADKDGNIRGCEDSGTLALLVHAADAAHFKVNCAPGTAPAGFAVQYRTHPNINKDVFSASNVLQLKDLTKAFPTEVSLPIVAWKSSGAAPISSDVLPLSFSVWPNDGPGGSSAGLNLELILNTSVTFKPKVMRVVINLTKFVGASTRSFNELFKVNISASQGKHRITPTNEFQWELDAVADANIDITVTPLPGNSMQINHSLFFPLELSLAALFPPANQYTHLSIAKVESLATAGAALNPAVINDYNFKYLVN